MASQSVREKVCIVGSGNWGSCVSKLVGLNLQRLHKINPTQWDEKVNMWVHEEEVSGRKLTDIINTEHVNVKYLPGIKLPENVLAVPDLIKAIDGATLLIFVLPHQFIERVCNQIKGHLQKPTRAISLVKGLDFEDCQRPDLNLISTKINNKLDIDISVLMGANLANDIAKERFSESTIGFSDAMSGAIWKNLFEHSYFKISLIDDVKGVELCGALKNVVALAAGFIDGLYPEGGADNTKAAIIRRGLLEMRAICRLIDFNVRDETFFESCGVADVVTSCYGGRNRKVAELFVRGNGSKTFEQLEQEALNGQKLQGPPTAKFVFEFLNERCLTEKFPLFASVYKICYENLDPHQFLSNL